jgi:hypothetical protein
MKKCHNCGKPIRWVEGSWFHTWWVKDPVLGSIPAGSSECAWRGRPAEHLRYAEPVVEGVTGGQAEAGEVDGISPVGAVEGLSGVGL